MRRKSPFPLISFLLFLSIISLLGSIWGIPKSQPIDLETVLEKCAEYCEKLDDLSLY
ncbi:MAG: hypothetical protein R6V00_02125 [Candidatus Aminicenantes bacterium]